LVVVDADDDRRRLWEALPSGHIYTLFILTVNDHQVKLLFPSARVLRRWRSKRRILQDGIRVFECVGVVS